MTSPFERFRLAATCGALVLFAQVAHADEGIFIPSAPPPAAEQNAHGADLFDSEYARQEHESGGGGNLPESDARPGTYYFLAGAAAFRKHDYGFAIQMYQVSASWAYKPAEYNIGVMYARGQGVPVDLPRAMAWMALAAERNEPRYVEARETVYAELSKEQFGRANVIWRELKRTYGDDVALRRAKARWAQVRASATGSHVGFVGHLDVGTAGGNSADPSNPSRGSEKKNQEYQHKWGGASHAVSSSAEVFEGGQEVDGTIAYRQLQQSDNPYDPKFRNPALGTATVGPPTTVKDKAADKNASEPAKG